MKYIIKQLVERINMRNDDNLLDDDKVLQMLYEATETANLQDDKNDLLIKAIGACDLQAVVKGLEDGADPIQIGRKSGAPSPLELAIRVGHKAICLHLHQAIGYKLNQILSAPRLEDIQSLLVNSIEPYYQSPPSASALITEGLWNDSRYQGVSGDDKEEQERRSPSLAHSDSESK